MSSQHQASAAGYAPRLELRECPVLPGLSASAFSLQARSHVLPLATVLTGAACCPTPQANSSHSRHAYAGASGHTLRLLAAGFVLSLAAASLLFRDSARRLVTRPALMPAGPGTRALAGCACAPCSQCPAGAAGGRPACPPPRRQWSPLMLPMEDKRWVHSWAHNASLPSMVDPTRRQLSMELGIGAVLSGVEGDFVETGVAAGECGAGHWQVGIAVTVLFGQCGRPTAAAWKEEEGAEGVGSLRLLILPHRRQRSLRQA